MMHVAVRLEHHQFVDDHAAMAAQPAKIISLQVDEHDVLGPFLGVRQQGFGIAPVGDGIPPAGACPGDGARLDHAVGGGMHQALR